MNNKEKENLKLWLFILILSIVVVGIIIFFTYKKIAYEKSKVETYIVYNNNYAYFYNNKEWNKINDISFLADKDFDVYSGNEFKGRWAINISENPVEITYNNGTKGYNGLTGIYSNKTIPFKSYEFENITDDHITFVRNYLSSKNQTYFEGQTEIKVIKMDIDADVIFENLYIIRYTSEDLYYAYFVIQDGSNTETVLAHTDDNYVFTHKTYNLGLIIDADLNEKKEILIIENGYEYSRLLLYSNQYRTYSLVE